MKNFGSKQILAALWLSVMLLMPFSLVDAQGSLLLSDYPDSYTVVEGDSLWNIASQFLRDPQRWPEVWQPDAYLDNADLIYPGDVLKIGFVGGSPRILVQRGGRTTVRLGPQIRVQPLLSVIPAISLESIQNSFTRNRIVSQALYDAAPYIVANVGDALIIGTGDEIYVRGTWPIGTRTFEIYREGRTFLDQSGEQDLGLEIEYLGFATISADEAPGLKRVLINNSTMEIRVGDRLLIREEARIDTTIFPQEPASYVAGQIIAFLGADSLASQLDTVIIDLGFSDNLAVGDILSILQPGDLILDEEERRHMTFRERLRATFRSERLQLPSKQIGTLLVYKTFEQLSYATILSSSEPAELYNQVASP